MPVLGQNGRDQRGELLPPVVQPLFADAFVTTCDLYEEFIRRLTLRVARESGLASALAEGPATAEVLAARAGLATGDRLPALDWLLRQLAHGGAVALEEGDPPRFAAASAAWPDADPDEPVRRQEEHDPGALPSYHLAEVAARSYPAFLRGEIEGDAALFGADTFNLWGEYFSNENGLYAPNNRLPAIALTEWRPKGPLSILELGGGLGSGASAVLDRLTETGRVGDLVRYHFTEIAPLFLRRGQRTLSARFAPGVLTTARLDMDQPLGPQGIEAGRFDVVFAINALHVAHDLQATLAEVRRTLAPGGLLLLGECVRPWPRQPIYIEFIFSMLGAYRAPRLDPALRPSGGFLTPEQWERALLAAGFAEVRFLPDVRTIRDVYPGFIVDAIGAVAPGA